MADATKDAVSSVLPIPAKGSSESMIHDSEDVIKAADVSPDEVISGRTDPEGRSTRNGIDGQTAHQTPAVDEQMVHPDQKSTGAKDEETEDTEMVDATHNKAEQETPTQSVAPPANGTPASTKRSATTGSSKKKAAVPEHKSKKLNRKKSRPMTNLNAAAGEYYFARMKGHAPWPSIICDEEMLPQNILTSRPVTARLPDGTFKKEEYADGGKRAHERTMPVMFLGTNEFAWMPNTDLSPINLEDEVVKDPSEKGKSKALLAAYAKLAEKRDLAHFKTMLLEHQKAMAEDIAALEAAAADKESKKSKKSRKSLDVVADDEVDMGDDAGTEKPKAKKRKKTDEDGDADEKPAKTPKTNQKFKLTTPKTPAESSKKKQSKAKPKDVKRKDSGNESEESTSKAAKVSMTSEQILEHKERQIMYRRHKLQRGLLVKPPAVPKEEEMKAMSDYLSEVSEYPDLEASILRGTKIHKVLKNIIKLDPKIIPNEDKFKFQQRSKDLLAVWTATLEQDGKGDDDTAEHGEAKKTDEKIIDKGDKTKAGASSTGTTPHTNGEAINNEAAKSAAPELSKDALERKIGTTVEGANEADDPAKDQKAQEHQKTAEEEKTDGPAIDTAPAAGFKPASEA